MKNNDLVKDYLIRSHNRLSALDVLFEKKSWPDVVRESQEVVELTLKALLKSCFVSVPMIHDVSQVLKLEKHRLPSAIQKDLSKIINISKDLRRDRELSFYGSEDLTPLEFYSKRDAQKARTSAQFVVKVVSQALKIP